MLGKVDQNRFRGRGARRDSRVNDSGRRRLPAQVNRSSVAEVRGPNCVNWSRRRRLADLRVTRRAEGKEHRAHMANGLRRQPAEPVKGMQMNCAPNEKECRALMVSRLHNSNSARSRSNGSPVARLPQPIAARPKDSRKAGRRDNQKKRHRHAHNNFGAITPVAPE